MRQIPLLFYRLAGSRCQPSPLGEGARGPARGRMRGSPAAIPRSRSAFRKLIPHPALRGHLPPLGGRQSCRPFTGKAPQTRAAAPFTVCFVGRGLDPSAAARGLAALRSAGRYMPPCGASGTPPLHSAPRCRGRACPARGLPKPPVYGCSAGERFIPPAPYASAAQTKIAQGFSPCAVILHTKNVTPFSRRSAFSARPESRPAAPPAWGRRGQQAPPRRAPHACPSPSACSWL